MNGLELVVEAPAELPLDEALVVVVRLRNDGDVPVTTSSRLNLLEGDLSVWLQSGDGPQVRVDWPWPVDSGAREATLTPGRELVGSALLLGPTLFPAAGDHSVLATFAAAPDVEVSAAPVVVRRTPPDDDAGRAGQRALEDPEVVQSICSMSLIGSAADRLALLAGSDERAVAQLRSTCVTTVTPSPSRRPWRPSCRPGCSRATSASPWPPTWSATAGTRPWEPCSPGTRSRPTEPHRPHAVRLSRSRSSSAGPRWPGSPR